MKPATLVGSVGVDSGQIAALAVDCLDKFKRDDLNMGWSGIVLKDGRHLEAGGKHFFHWNDDKIADTGMSANQLIDKGLAIHVDAVLPAVCEFSYSGACNATLSRSGFAPLLDDRQIAVGFAMRTAHGDGGYAIERRRLKIGDAKARDFVVVDTSASPYEAGSARRPVVAIGTIRTGGLVLLCDPCDPSDGVDVPILADPLGWSTVYGVAEAGGGRLVALAFEAAPQ